MLRIVAMKLIRHRSKVVMSSITLTLLIFIPINMSRTSSQKSSIADGATIFSEPPESVAQTLEIMRDQRLPTTTAPTTTVMQTEITTPIIQKTDISLNLTAIVKENMTSQNINQNIPSTVTPYQPSSQAQGYRIGHVNVHLWYKMCTISFDEIRQHPLFPLWPSLRGQPNMPGELESISTSLWSLQRVMGLLYPPITGKYRFKIFSDDSISEFWLSLTPHSENAKLIARNNQNVAFGIMFTRGKSMSTSEPIQLNQGQTCYFEILHGRNNQFNGRRIRVQWMLPGNETFTGIPETTLSTVIKVDNNRDIHTKKLLLGSASLALQNTPSISPKHRSQRVNNNSKTSVPNFPSYDRDDLHTMQLANHWKIMSAFDVCDYKPSYAVKRKYKRYSGVFNTHFSDVFPDDGTGEKYFQGPLGIQWDSHHLGNPLIEKHVVFDIVNTFMATVDIYFPGEYTLDNIIRVERNIDPKRGNRFFLELVLLEVKTKQLQRLSQYVFQFKNDPKHLCKPKGLNWSHTVKINVILTTKNQGPWVIHYIKNMAEIVHATRDDNVHFIVVDYGNNGVDVAEEFTRNNVTSFTIIKKNGKFHKTLAIDEAAKSVKDVNSIVFLTDLHLTAPHNIFEIVRKHTIKGYMAFTPITFRLAHCSRPPTEQSPIASGYWETGGFGIFSTYKSDWDNFGGVNVKEYKHKWGGEDWEMVDRVLEKGIEIEVQRLPNFFHFYHDKKGMWQEAR